MICPIQMIQQFYLIICKSFPRLVQNLGPELPKNQNQNYDVGK